MAKLLLVEDDINVLNLYHEVFSKQNYQVDTAMDGEAGLEKAKANVPDLILLDIMIPKMNGFELLEKLKENPTTKNVPVLMLTNLGEEQYVRRAIALGAEGFIIKANFSLEKIVTEVGKKIEDIKEHNG